MSKRRIVGNWICIAFLLLQGCSNDAAFGPYWGRVSADKNGGEWKGEIKGTEQDDLLGLTIDRLTSEGYLREDLFIDRIPMTVGVHVIPRTDTLRKYQFVTARYFTLQDDGDVIEGMYYVDPAANNFVEIKSIRRGVFRGNFQIRLLIDPLRKATYPHLPDTISFTNGEFKTKILLKN